MYRHLLVPVDGTDPSTETVGRAVEFAYALGARITFFHARPDREPEDHSREFLVKAESAARAQGVPCESLSSSSDAPPLAIVDAAREAGCDLIFMAAQARSPVSGKVIGIIRDEHRSLSAVLHAGMHLIGSAQRRNIVPDPALMNAIVCYLQKFPVALHHPKEDEFLFRKLRERTSEVDAELDELERQHARDRQLVTELAAMVERLAGGHEDLAKVQDAVARYAKFVWEHLGREEGVILPAAERWLTAEDWAGIDAAFAENSDPRFGGDTEAEFRRLFSRIVNLAAPAAALAQA